jgi:hypothetical protein
MPKHVVKDSENQHNKVARRRRHNLQYLPSFIFLEVGLYLQYFVVQQFLHFATRSDGFFSFCFMQLLRGLGLCNHLLAASILSWNQ